MLTNHYCKCDKCGTSRQFANRPFDEILKVIRAAGWRVTKNGKGWHHYCADCVKKWNRAKLKPSVTARKPPEPTPARGMWWQQD